MPIKPTEKTFIQEAVIKAMDKVPVRSPSEVKTVRIALEAILKTEHVPGKLDDSMKEYLQDVVDLLTADDRSLPENLEEYKAIVKQVIQERIVDMTSGAARKYIQSKPSAGAGAGVPASAHYTRAHTNSAWPLEDIIPYADFEGAAELSETTRTCLTEESTKPFAELFVRYKCPNLTALTAVDPGVFQFEVEALKNLAENIEVTAEDFKDVGFDFIEQLLGIEDFIQIYSLTQAGLDLKTLYEFPEPFRSFVLRNGVRISNVVDKGTDLTLLKEFTPSFSRFIMDEDSRLLILRLLDCRLALEMLNNYSKTLINEAVVAFIEKDPEAFISKASASNPKKALRELGFK